MFKRILLIPILLLYLISIAGIRMQAHYCHQEFSELSFNPFHQAECGCSKEEKSCCDDAQFLLQITTVYAPSPVITTPDVQLISSIISSFEEFHFQSITPIQPNPFCFSNEFPPPDKIVSCRQFKI